MRKLFPLPPPVLAFAVGAIMYILPSVGQYERSFYLIGLFILLSSVVALASVWQFYREKTTIDPQQLEKTTRLVTSGIFQFTRNPMYLSILFTLIAWALWLENLLAWIGVPIFIFLMNRFQIAREERFLEQKFGEEYHRYKEKVRRWL